jgi:uncharacterized membrane protein (DUF485 family)
MPISSTRVTFGRLLTIVVLTAFVFAILQSLYVLHPGIWQSIRFFNDPHSGFSAHCSAIFLDDAHIAKVRLWVILAIADSALAGAISAWSFLAVASLWSAGASGGRLRGILTIAWKFFVFAAILLWISPQSGHDYFLGCYQSSMRDWGAGVPLYVAIALSMIALWAVELRVRDIDTSSKSVDSFREYVMLRSRMQSIFTLVSLVFVGGMIQIAARHSMEASLLGSTNSSWDVLLEGLGYTILLAGAYIPIHARFNAVGGDLAETICQRPSSPDAEEIVKWTQIRASIEERLKLGSYEWKTFGPGLAVMAPAIVGFVSKIVQDQVIGK